MAKDYYIVLFMVKYFMTSETNPVFYSTYIAGGGRLYLEITELFNKIYDETFDDMRRYIAVKCSDTAYIADILQETYLDYYYLILKKGNDHISDHRAVLFKIAKRKIYRYYSLKEKLKFLLPLYQTSRDGDEYEADIISEDSFEDDILSAIESDRIWKIISEYPADIRKIFHLYFYEEMSHSQIAKEMNCSLSNVKNKLYRTLDEIREKGRNNEQKNQTDI